MSLEQAKKELEEYANQKRIEAGNNLMNYITEYFRDQQEYYREEFGENYIEAMRNDRIWVLECDEKFKELCRKYFELTIGG